MIITKCYLPSFCRNPGEDTKMLVCDMCDKGYHTFCLQPAMDTLPTNGWRCKVWKTRSITISLSWSMFIPLQVAQNKMEMCNERVDHYYRFCGLQHSDRLCCRALVPGNTVGRAPQMINLFFTHIAWCKCKEAHLCTLFFRWWAITPKSRNNVPKCNFG